METVAFCEIDHNARNVLKKHWPQVPIYKDIRTITKYGLPHVDLICGGFPCQPFSKASRGRQVATDLWPQMLRVIKIFSPEWVIAENVSAEPIITAFNDLTSRGYKCERRNIKATDCGADHQRSRWWVIAHADDESEFSGPLDDEVAQLPEICKGLWGHENYARAFRVSDGLPGRMDRLKQLGNSVLPQIPEVIGRVIMGME